MTLPPGLQPEARTTGRAGHEQDAPVKAEARQPDGAPVAAVPGESNRARVRRLLLDPLGFRFRRGTGEEAQRKFLDTVADELAHMSAAQLQVLFAMLKGKGQGEARNVWPDLATVRGFAHVVAPRPLSDEPALRRWFGSIEGPQAILDGTLVETARYFLRNHAPPVTPGARAKVREAAVANARRLQIIEEKRGRGIDVPAHDAEWAREYRAARAYWEEVVRIEREAKGAA